MIPDWPNALHRFTRSDFQQTRQDGRRRIGADAGPPRFRRRFSAIARMVSLGLVVTRSEREIFDAFYADTCRQGSLTFRMPDPSTEGWPLLDEAGASVLSAAGIPIRLSATWLCAWGDEPPVEVMDGDVEFRIQFQVWVLP